MSQPTDSSPVIPDSTTRGPVRFGDSVSFEWLEDGRIAVFTLKDSSRGSIDTFFKVNIAFAEQHRGKTVYIMNDATSPDIELTPFLRQKITKLAGVLSNNDITAIVASVIQRGFSSTLAKLFGNILSKTTPHITQKFFNDRDEALDWLKEQLPDQ